MSGPSQSSGAQNDAFRQEAMYYFAREAGAYGLNALKTSGSVVKDYIERGPAGVQWLCFLGGLFTFVFGLVGFVCVWEIVEEPLIYLINVYQMMFGFATCIIESPAEWTTRNQKLKDAQVFFHEFARFLTTLGGRGLFYLFQGSLAMSIDGWSLAGLLALYMFAMGCLNILMQFGCMHHSSPATSPSGAEDYIHVH